MENKKQAPKRKDTTEQMNQLCIGDPNSIQKLNEELSPKNKNDSKKYMYTDPKKAEKFLKSVSGEGSGGLKKEDKLQSTFKKIEESKELAEEKNSSSSGVAFSESLLSLASASVVSRQNGNTDSRPQQAAANLPRIATMGRATTQEFSSNQS